MPALLTVAARTFDILAVALVFTAFS